MRSQLMHPSNLGILGVQQSRVESSGEWLRRGKQRHLAQGPVKAKGILGDRAMMGRGRNEDNCEFRAVVSDSFLPHGLHQARPPCP